MTAHNEPRPAIARIWRGRTTRADADEYQSYNYEEGIKPLESIALGVEQLREDGEHETEFMTISYWESLESMTEFTNAEPEQIHHLDRDPEFLIELPDRVQILSITASHWNIRSQSGT